MKTKSMFLAMFSFVTLLVLNSCTAENLEDVEDCVRNGVCVPDEDDEALTPENMVENDSTVVVSKLPVRD